MESINQLPMSLNFGGPCKTTFMEKVQYPGSASKALGSVSVQNIPEFYEDGLMKLPERCQKIIDLNGQYIINWIIC